MTDLRTAAPQALEVLENCTSEHGHRCSRCDSEVDEGGKVVAALRAALGKPVQEPVLVVEKEPDYWCRGHFHQGRKSHIDPTKVWSLPIGAKLYTAPPQRPPLTDEEIKSMWGITEYREFAIDFARAIESAHGIGDA